MAKRATSGPTVDEVLAIADELCSGDQLTAERLFVAAGQDQNLLRDGLVKARANHEACVREVDSTEREFGHSHHYTLEERAKERTNLSICNALSGAVGVSLDALGQPSVAEVAPVPQLTYSEFCTVLNLEEQQRTSLLILLKKLDAITIQSPE